MNGMNSGEPQRMAPAAILSQAGGAPPEGAETTWGLAAAALGAFRVGGRSALKDRQERPAP